jgi:hypothetical protein
MGQVTHAGAPPLPFGQMSDCVFNRGERSKAQAECRPPPLPATHLPPSLIGVH